MNDRNDINKIIGDYKYGFHTEVEDVLTTGKGLSREVVEKISEFKNEPTWMKDIRIKAYENFWT